MKLVIVAGAGCGHGFYRDVVKELKDIYTDVELILPLGEDYEEIINSVYDKLKIIKENFVLLGHCMGGMVSMDIVCNKVKLNNMRKLILLNTYFDFTFMDKQFIKDSGESVDSYSEDAIKRVKDGLLDGAIASKQLDIILTRDLTDSIKNIDFKTLIIGSDNDPLFSVEKLSNLRDNIKFSKLHILKKARHLAFITHIDEVKRTIVEWNLSTDDYEYGKSEELLRI